MNVSKIITSHEQCTKNMMHVFLEIVNVPQDMLKVLVDMGKVIQDMVKFDWIW
jgi:hypothetical protein